MKTTVKNANEQLRNCLISAVEKAKAAGELIDSAVPEFKIEIPQDKCNGDISANIALISAKAFHTAPRKIADAIIKHIDLTDTYFESIEAAGPGFLNLKYSQKFYVDTLLEVDEKGKKYGHSDVGKGKRALVEFVSANPTGPMHVGNARGGAMGDTLAEILSWAGYETEREFYVNDAGNQIEKFGLSLSIRYRQHFGEEIEMPEDSYHGQDIIDHVNDFAAEYGDKYMSADEQTRKKALVDYALPKNIAGLERDLLGYGIRYDNWFRESTLHKNGEAAKMVDLLTERGYAYEKDGAVWFKAEQFGCDKDFVLKRSNGFYTYIVPDIAYHYNKLVTRNFDRAIDVLGADHHGYVPRLKAALTACGADASKLEVVLMQMVRLVKDGEIVKASKRSGKAITLVTLLEEVSVDQARFIFNSSQANTHCDFDLDLAVEESSKNPVYYCQYAHARICSIFRKADDSGIKYGAATSDELALLTHEDEKNLIAFIGTLTDVIESAATSNDSSKITRFATELASNFHKFYNACRCDVEDEHLRNARLFLCMQTRNVMKNVLELMKISAPEKM